MFLLFFSLLNCQLIYVLFTILIIIKLKDEFKNHELIYEKFLYERYIYNLNFKKVKIINNINNFYKDYHHYLKYDDKVVCEKAFLTNKYACNR